MWPRAPFAEAVRSALAQGAMVEEVSHRAAEQLDAHGGMAARLRYAAPAPAPLEAAERR